MSKRSPDFARVLTPSSASEDKEPLRASECDAVIELGFLMANADGKVSDVLDQLTDNLDKADAIEERVRAIVPLLTRPAARDLAYKAVYTIAVFDLETNEAERELDDLLVDVLGLAARVDDLELEVNEALNG